MDEPRQFLLRALKAAIDAALPAQRVKAFLPEPRAGRTIVIGAGKAAASMAAAVEEHWVGPLSGLVVTRYGHRARTHRIEVIEASHPTPDGAGEAAARRMMDLVAGLGSDDLVLCLISGADPRLLPCRPQGCRSRTMCRSTRRCFGAAPRSRK